jgi:hypothetical protein
MGHTHLTLQDDDVIIINISHDNSKKNKDLK